MGALCSSAKADEFHPVLPASSQRPCSKEQTQQPRTEQVAAADGEPKALQRRWDTTSTEDPVASEEQSHQSQTDGQTKNQDAAAATVPVAAAPTGQQTTEQLGKAFADMTQLCAMVCKVEICTISLVSSNAPWLPSAWLSTPEASQMPFRDTPFCTWTLQQPMGTPLVVPDTLQDARFKNSPHVAGTPHVRFYAGVPLCGSDNKPIAALCIMDTKPACEGLLPAEARRAMLSNFADMATRELEREQALAAQQAAQDALGNERARLLRLMDLIGDGQAVLLLEVPRPTADMAAAAPPARLTADGQKALESSDQAIVLSSTGALGAAAHKSMSSAENALNVQAAHGPWRILGVNDGWQARTGLTSALAEGHDFWGIFRGAGSEEDAEQAQGACTTAAGSRQNFTAVLQLHMPAAKSASASPLEDAASKVGAASAAAAAAVAAAEAAAEASNTANSAAPMSSGSASADKTAGASTQSIPAVQTLQLVFRCVEAGGSRKSDSCRTNVQTDAAGTAASGGKDHHPAPCYYCVSLAGETPSPGVSRHSVHSRSSHRELLSSPNVSGAALSLLNSSGVVASGSSAVMLLTSTKMSKLGDRAPLLDDLMNVSRHLQVVSLLGHGSFGRVYLGTYNGEAVAIKILEWEAQGGGGHVLEALLSAQIEHPNIVKTYKHGTRPLRMARQSFGGDGGHGDAGMAGGEGGLGGYGVAERRMMETWMVMEYADRGTLTDAVELGWMRQGSNSAHVNSGSFAGSGRGGHDDEPDLTSLLATACEVASAMLYLHSMDILHGDLTGSNILLCSNQIDERRGFVAKVADFGLSRVLATDTVQTKTYGAVSHTPPELLLTGCLSKAVDVYAFGVILWEMLMGQRPYRGLTQAQIINHISNGRGLALYSECPSALRKLVGRCLSSRPDERPCFSQILEQLQALQEELC